MTNRNRLLLFLIAILWLLMFFQQEASAVALKVKIGNTAPDFTLRSLNGEFVSLSDYLGKKPVHMFFWATWCPSCRTELKILETQYKKYQAAQVELLAINVGMRESLDRVQNFIYKSGLQSPVLFDKGGKISTNLYGTLGIPTNIVIDINGIIRYNDTQLPQDFDKILNRKPATPSTSSKGG